ncbi:glycosyltransferase family 2 protein [Desulfurispira natronophila]|uniref:Glycosyltransferase involved in cell wall biosynthesis n=1 Tax=Desulfurispira natronophila TaxID=682562 RepID=A0A7W8DI04_9BACT|nr:glycosyltransferase family 2 protein [Desulfurispira natronophila]MBB5022848.1 glycosyltransferase involved in cell wall biosynthesis [Desulfurispira natronophila]
MDNMGLVSIIMPCHNSEKYISLALRSVQNQTYPSWELIVVDDCSTDGTVEIITDFARSDSRIRLISLADKSGPAVARNAAIEASAGRYIAFLDSDDVWLPEKLQKQIQLMQENNVSVSYSAYYTVDEKGERTGVRNQPSTIRYRDLLCSNFIGNLTGIYDAAALGKTYFKKVHHEDYALWLDLLKKTDRAMGVAEPLAEYRVQSSSLSSNKIKSMLWTWKIYRDVEGLSLYKSVRCYVSYLKHAILKRF